MGKCMSYGEFIKDISTNDPENDACLTSQDVVVLYSEYEREFENE